MNYALLIRDLRKRLNLTQEEFAQKIGANRGNITQVEIGKQKPTLELLTSIVRTFNIDGNIFFKEETQNITLEEPLIAYEQKATFSKHTGKSNTNSDEWCEICAEKEQRIAVMQKLLDEKERLIKVLLDKK